jgi:hypothetical protein
MTAPGYASGLDRGEQIFFVSERFQACVFRLDPLTSCQGVVRDLPETCRWVAEAPRATLVAEATGFLRIPGR